MKKIIILLLSLFIIWLFLYNRYTIIGAGQKVAYRLNRLTGETHALLGYQADKVIFESK